MQNKKREIVFFEDHFYDFYVKQRQKVKDKIIWTFRLFEQVDVVPEVYLKHLDGTEGLYEMRVQQGSDIFRIFCCFDEGKLVVLLNGFQKKTQKTPQNELEKAKRLKDDYFRKKTIGSKMP